MAEPHEAASSLLSGARHASGAGSGGSASVDRAKHSLSSTGGSSMASGTTHVEAAGPGSDSNLSFLEPTTTSSSHTGSRLSSTSPTPQIRREPEPARTSRASHRSSHRHNRSSGAFLLNDALHGARSGHDASHGKFAQSTARSGGNRETHGRERERYRSEGSSRGGGALLAAPVTPDQRGRGSSAEPAPDARRARNASGSSDAAVSPASADAAVLATITLPSPPSSAGSASPVVSNQTLDIDSAQIVNMALNLSESRRLASRRNVTQQLPPRLTPLPDSAVGGSLLRQLQQQRRISRTISPRPDKGPGGRAVSGQVANSSPRVSSSGGLRPAFDPLGDAAAGAYRYHFSQSTLARAQKAKDYLELLAQQRRLLEFISPLTPASTTQMRSTSLTSPPTTSSNSSNPFLGTTSSSGDLVSTSARLGRPYNPLQYIRNRKVRVRERKTIDGQALGFGDVSKAAEWVDEVARWAATGQGRVPDGPTLPSFSSADALTAALQSSPPPGSRSAGQGVLAKPKRPRLDWAIDPADMLADVYWLEQGDNKMLVEDRHWRRVFPQDPKLYRPASQRVGEGNAPDQTGDPSVFQPTSFLDPSTSQLLRTPDLADAEHDQGSTRKRARQKLSELRSFHHRHNSSFQSHDILRLRRGSFSDTSDSDSDRRMFGRRAKDSTSATNNADTPNLALLRKAAHESREKDGSSTSSPAAPGDQKSQMSYASVGSPANADGQSSQSTPAKGELPSKFSAAPFASRAIDTSVRSSRASLDIPNFGKRRSLEYDSSLPASPELRPLANEDIGLVPVLGGDLSLPPSRATSPPPSRFSKVKHMFRDHSHERGRERTNSSGFDRGSQEQDDLLGASSTYTQSLSLPQQEAAEAQSAPITATPSVAGEIYKIPTNHDIKDLQSPMRKGLSRSNTATFESHKSHSSITSISSMRHSNHVLGYSSHNQHRSEESGATVSASSTLRGIFKGGPRIDTMLRSGVSKVSDMLWRRDGSDTPYDGAGAGDAGSSSSSDDSDGGLTFRGRLRKTPRHSRSPSMNADWSEKSTSLIPKPGEKHYLDVMPSFGGQDHKGRHYLSPSPDPVSRPPSRRSTRFERLRPPRIDVQDATSPSSNITNFRPQIPSREAGDATSLLPGSHQRSQRTAQDSDISESDTSRSRRVSDVNGDVLPSVEKPLDASTASLQQQQLSVPAYEGGFANADRPRWSVSQPTYRNQGDSLSRRELARLRASMYSSAVLARELSRRANKPRVLGGDDTSGNGQAICVRRKVVARSEGEMLTWPDIAVYSTNPTELMHRPIRHVELYPLAAQVLGAAIQRSGQSWQTSAELFTSSTIPALRERVDSLRTRVAVELSGLARKAADDADVVSQDLVAVQRLQVLRVEDTIEMMLRRRRRRFRWVRRAGWLTVEWMLVGIMWFAWFVVMIARVVMGSYRGIVAGVRWLLWL
ncbi:hypothetical protein F503_07351 [Ophiostoma piceae UAMH 11346]|uniref:Uncharacterized protein n=1 Tax=Ophiostoma piceae (strain UAMH 11346) TaxID=1262450 RepID=S3D810_OPHP1|nr:hypothetical protein F503_07351 [Ophiostoma piceae UAMH 11346]